MNKTNFKKYLSHVKEKRKSTIEDRYIEKDYAISLFFSMLNSNEKFKILI